jgi:hypothetical protein
VVGKVGEEQVGATVVARVEAEAEGAKAVVVTEVEGAVVTVEEATGVVVQAVVRAVERAEEAKVAEGEVAGSEVEMVGVMAGATVVVAMGVEGVVVREGAGAVGASQVAAVVTVRRYAQERSSCTSKYAGPRSCP